MRKLANWLTFKYEEISEEEQIFTNEWISKHQTMYMIAVARFCRWLFPIFASILFISKSTTDMNTEIFALILLTILAWMGTLIKSLSARQIQSLTAIACLILFFGSAVILQQTFSQQFDPSLTAVVTNTYIAAHIFSIRVFPYRSPLVILWAIVQFLVAVKLFSLNPELKIPDLIAELALIAAISVGLFYSWIHRLHSEAVLEFRARKILSEDEKSKQLALQRDIEAAERNAYGDGSTFKIKLARDLTVSMFQRRFSALGGDWATYKVFPDGKIVLIVADATGKGIQAALVIQALRTMWDTIQNQDTLSPIPWLNTVNKVFFQLGHRRDHTLTLGLLELDDKGITYYSAGHVPVFVIRKEKDGSEQVDTVVGRGSPLGLDEELSVEPVRHDFDLSELSGLMLGTDGVFDRGVRTRKRDIVKLQQVFTINGEAGLNDLPQHDDQLVVWLHSAA